VREGRITPEQIVDYMRLIDQEIDNCIAVTRRLHRNGDSEYLINKVNCRLRDVQELFAGTGLGGAHYAIIEQGRIGQVLSAKPLDRRSLIEEAAKALEDERRRAEYARHLLD